MSEEWVIDLTLYRGDKMFCFCPYDEETGTVVTGLSYISSEPPPGELVGIVHLDGQDACEASIETWKEHLSPFMGETE